MDPFTQYGCLSHNLHKTPQIPNRSPPYRHTLSSLSPWMSSTTPAEGQTDTAVVKKVSYCLNVLEVTALMLSVERLVIEQPEEGHLQGGVMGDLTAEHYTLSHRNLHPDGAQLHPHGLCNKNGHVSSAQFVCRKL